MSGHTWRYRYYYGDERRPKIEVENRPTIQYENGTTEVGVTEVDQFFQEDFLLSKTRDVPSLNKCWRWFAEEMLLSSCIEHFTKYNRRNSRIDHIYRVPIIGSRLFQDNSSYDIMAFGSLACINTDGQVDRKSQMNKSKNPTARYLYWRGQYFDVDFVYSFDGANLKSLFPLRPAMPVFTNKNICKFKIRVHNEVRTKVPISQIEINHEAKRSRFYGNVGWPFQSSTDFAEIDLGEFKFVTHIGSAGSYPMLDIFPKKKDIGKKRYRLFKLANQSYQNHVHVIHDLSSEPAWVSSYEISYRHYLSKKWICLGNFVANSDAITEHINDLFQSFNRRNGLYTRYLRIRPTEFNCRSVLRLAIYGHDSDSSVYRNMDDNSNTAKLEMATEITDSMDGDSSGNDQMPRELETDSNHFSDTDISHKVVSQEEIVDYVVSPHCTSNSSKCVDGTLKYYDPYCYNRCSNKGKGKRRIVRSVEEDLKDGMSWFYESYGVDGEYDDWALKQQNKRKI